jgi:hypothetical protein
VRNGLAVLCVMITIALVKVVPAGDSAVSSRGSQLSPIETFLTAPVELEPISIWVPAAKFGPEINWSCNMRKGCSHSAVLSAAVEHTKAECCPEESARMLAEYTAGCQQEGLPLTMFAGWRWEYSYSPCQFDSVSFDLPKRSAAVPWKARGKLSCPKAWLRLTFNGSRFGRRALLAVSLTITRLKVTSKHATFRR